MRFFYLLIAAGMAGLASCSGSHEPPPEHTVAARLALPPQLDVHALVGISIYELSQRIGPAQPVPAEFTNPMLRLASLGDGTDSLSAFQRNGLTLLATYNTVSRTVSELIVAGHSEDSLMQRAHLQANAPGYIIMPIFKTNRSRQLMGLRLVPLK